MGNSVGSQFDDYIWFNLLDLTIKLLLKANNQ